MSNDGVFISANELIHPRIAAGDKTSIVKINGKFETIFTQSSTGAAIRLIRKFKKVWSKES